MLERYAYPTGGEVTRGSTVPVEYTGTAAKLSSVKKAIAVPLRKV